jgi:mono/diheme cytochrome c family protein
VPVLGVSALQLSPDRDPLAPHAEQVTAEQIDLRGLVERGLLRKLPATYLKDAPRVPAATPVARAALGYMHGNCGHCHNDVGSLASLGLSLAQATDGGATRTVTSLLAGQSRFRSHGLDRRIVPGRADASVLAIRVRSRDPLKQMPPVGTQILDAEGYALISRWIEELYFQQESTR